MTNQNIRPLGFWESACKFGHDFFKGTGNVTARANIRGKIDVSQVQTILKILFLRHPLLQAVIKETLKDFYFSLSANFSDIPLKIFYCDQESDRHHKHVDFYLQVVDEEQSKPFVIEQYLWKVILVVCNKSNSHTLIVTFHHSIADGLSAANFFHEFMMFYTNQMNFEKLPFLASIESMLAGNISWETFIENKTKLNDKNIHLFSYQVFAPLSQRIPRNIYKAFSKEKTSSIRECCRKNDTTITAFLNAVLLLTVCKLEESGFNIALHTPINLRNCTVDEIAVHHFGCYISMVKTIHTNVEETNNIWELAKAYKNELNTEISKTGLYPKDFSLKNFEIDELVKLFDMAGSTKRKHFTIGLGITNIGPLNLLETYGSLILEDFMFTTNHVMGEYLMFLHVLTLHDQLKICFNFTEPLVSRTWAELFVKQFEHYIEEALL